MFDALKTARVNGIDGYVQIRLIADLVGIKDARIRGVNSTGLVKVQARVQGPSGFVWMQLVTEEDFGDLNDSSESEEYVTFDSLGVSAEEVFSILFC